MLLKVFHSRKIFRRNTLIFYNFLFTLSDLNNIRLPVFREGPATHFGNKNVTTHDLLLQITKTLDQHAFSHVFLPHRILSTAMLHGYDAFFSSIQGTQESSFYSYYSPPNRVSSIAFSSPSQRPRLPLQSGAQRPLCRHSWKIPEIGSLVQTLTRYSLLAGVV